MPSYVQPQAVPVYNLIKAIETSDYELYKSVWTTDTWNMYSHEWKSKWKKIRSGWSKIIREDLGSFGLDDFRYEYEKRSPIEGVIWILKNGKRQELSFNVEIKNGIWRIPEK